MGSGLYVLVILCNGYGLLTPFAFVDTYFDLGFVNFYQRKMDGWKEGRMYVFYSGHSLIL